MRWPLLVASLRHIKKLSAFIGGLFILNTSGKILSSVDPEELESYTAERRQTFGHKSRFKRY